MSSEYLKFVDMAYRLEQSVTLASPRCSSPTLCPRDSYTYAEKAMIFSTSKSPNEVVQLESTKDSLTTRDKPFAHRIQQKRNEYYSRAWPQLLAAGHNREAATAITRHLKNRKEDREGFAGVETYYGLARACGSSQSKLALKLLQEVNNDELTSQDAVDLALISAILHLDQGNASLARKKIRTVLPSFERIEREYDCYYILGLSYAYGNKKDYLEAAFYQSLLPKGSTLSSQVVGLLKDLEFKNAAWHALSIVRYDREILENVTESFEFFQRLPIPSYYTKAQQ